MKYFTLLFVAVLFSLGVSAQITNPGFDSGPDVGWTEYSLNFGTPLCDAGCGTCGGFCAPHAGSWYVWFGGIDAHEEAAISQTITIPEGDDGVLYFYVKVTPNGDDDPSTVDPVVVTLGDQVLLTTSPQDSVNFAEWTIQYFDVSDFTDGGEYELSIAAIQDGASSILFDSFNLEVDGVSTGLFDLQMNGERTFALYPNPANDAINLSFGHDLQYGAIVRILDMNGRVVSQESIGQISNRTFSMDTQWMTAGLYTLEVVNGGERMTERFAVAH